MENDNNVVNLEEASSDMVDAEKNIVSENAEDDGIEIDFAKQLEFDISMSSTLLNDYMLHHVYNSVDGLIATCIGAAGIIRFLSKGTASYGALIFGIIIILYFPVTIFMNSKKQMALVAAYKKPLHYVINERGIEVSQGNEKQLAGWKNCTKAVSTKKSIIVYTGKKNACIFAREQLGDKMTPLISVIAENMDPKKIKIRF